jgi:hypothetical protein
MLAAVGLDRVIVVEVSPENTPEILRKVRAVLFNSTKARRTMEIEA